MTILAGFRCTEGIVLCADTQESIQGTSPKRQVPKLRFEPFGRSHEGDDLAVAFCGAGDGPFTDKLIANAWQDAQIATNIEEACSGIEESIKKTYKEFGRVFQVGFCPSSDLLYGVKMHGESRLMMASGPIVNEKEKYETCGSGYYLANFIADRMHSDYLTLHQCVILAAYILFQTKEHCVDCGGESHIAILRNEGVSGKVDAKRIETITELTQFADFEGGRLLLDMANLDLDKAAFSERIASTMGILADIRENQRTKLAEKIKSGEEFSRMFGTQRLPEDEFGLPLPTLKKPELEEPKEQT